MVAWVRDIDIAARNVVLSLDSEDTGGSGVPVAKVTDFGLSRCTGRRKRDGAAVADTYYATVDATSGLLRTAIPFPWTAPECLELTETKHESQSQSSSAAAADSRSGRSRLLLSSSRNRTRVRPTVRATSANDVWAFGVLLWEIETGGAAPFKGLKESVMKHVRQGGRLIPPASASPILERAMQRAWEPAESRPPMKVFLDVLLGPSKEKRELLARVSEWGPEEAAVWLDRHGVPRDHELRRIAAAARGGAGFMRRLADRTEKSVKWHADDLADDNHENSSVSAPGAVSFVNPLIQATNTSQGESKTGTDTRRGIAADMAAFDPEKLQREMLGLQALEQWTLSNY